MTVSKVSAVPIRSTVIVSAAAAAVETGWFAEGGEGEEKSYVLVVVVVELLRNNSAAVDAHVVWLERMALLESYDSLSLMLGVALEVVAAAVVVVVVVVPSVMSLRTCSSELE